MSTVTLLTRVQYQPSLEREVSTSLLLLLIVIIVVGRALASEIRTLAALITAVVSNMFAILRALIGVLLVVLLVIALAYFGEGEGDVSPSLRSYTTQFSIPSIPP